MDLRNKTVLVTGASRGLGKETAIALSKKGARLILTARSREDLNKVQQQIQETVEVTPRVIACDISLEEEVHKMALIVKEESPSLDILINNAGTGIYQTTENLPAQLMRQQFALNFFGAWYCIKTLLPLLKKNRRGYILNVGSLFSFVSLAETSVYAATKFALAGYTEGLRQELRPFGIKVGLFAPGAIDTSFQDQKSASSLKTPKSFMMEPEKGAKMIVKMLERESRLKVYPKWQLMLLRLKRLRNTKREV